MNIKKFTIIIFSIFLSASAFTQDNFHYTYFDMTGVGLNPALAGGFNGTARIGGLFREQDFGVQAGQFRSPILSVDAPLIRGLRKQDWIGFGIGFQYDQQAFSAIDNTNKLITTTSVGGLSYHFAFDKKAKNVLAIGVQSGSSSVYFTDPYLITPESLDEYKKGISTEQGREYLDQLPQDKNKKSNNIGWTIGTVFTSNISKTDNLKVGLSVANIGKRLRFTVIEKGSSSYRRHLRYVTFGQYRTELSNGLILEPRVFFQYIQPSWEVSIQTLVGLKLKKPTPMTLYGGLGYNVINGLQFLMGADIKDLKVGFSFDLNLTDKPGGAAGAFELGVSYILKIRKKPNPDAILLCPRI